MASRDSQKRTIGRYEYIVIPLGAREGCRVLSRLMKLMGRGAAKGTEEEALGAILENLEESDADYFIATFDKYTSVRIGDKTPPLADIFDAHFISEYLEMLGWLKFAMEVNFAGFFSGVGGLGLVAPSTDSSKSQSSAPTA